MRASASPAFRFAAFFSLAFTVLIVVLGAATHWAMRKELRYELDQRVVATREALLREAVNHDAGLRGAVAYRSAHERGDMRYALFDRTGKLVAGRGVAAVPSVGWSAMDFINSDHRPDDTRALASRTADGGLLIVGSDPEALEELDHHMVTLVAAAFGLIAAIGVTGAFLFGRLLHRRLDAINTTAEGIIGGDLSRRVPVSGTGDEFDRLAATLNQMLERIESLLGNVRQISGDIAHDLRTPLTRLRQKLELASAGPDEPARLKCAIDDAIDQTDDTLALFAGILGISEIEAGGAGVRMSRVDLTALVTDLADSYQPALEDAGRKLIRNIVPGVEVEGNKELLAQAGVNLLDNALRHTPPGTEIGISLAARGDEIALAVSDRGIGVPPADRERVFHRFTRLESSRSTPGHGLGLSLVAAIAHAHGGSAAIEENHPGAIVMITFPRRTR